MIETNYLNVGIAVEPNEDGTKSILVMDREGAHLHRIPLGGLNDEIIADLNLTNEELQEKINRKMAATKIDIVDGRGMPMQTGGMI